MDVFQVRNLLFPGADFQGEPFVKLHGCGVKIVLQKSEKNNNNAFPLFWATSLVQSETMGFLPFFGGFRLRSPESLEGGGVIF